MSEQKFAEITPEEFEDLQDQLAAKNKPTELYTAQTGQGEMLFRCPNTSEYNQCMDVLQSERSNPTARRNAARKYVLRCVLWPKRDVLTSLLDAKPGLASHIAIQITEVAEGNEEALAKKPEPPSTEPDTTSTTA